MLNFWLEVSNSCWAIAAFGLLVVCLAYLQHELIAHRTLWPHWRWRVTLGMRVAIAMSALGIGILITSVQKYIWRHFFDATDYVGDLQTSVFLFGSVMVLVGLFCAIREYSQALYGNWPWIATLVLMAGFTAYNVISNFY